MVLGCSYSILVLMRRRVSIVVGIVGRIGNFRVSDSGLMGGIGV